MRLAHQNESGGMLRDQVYKKRQTHKKSLHAFKHSKIPDTQLFRVSQDAEQLCLPSLAGVGSSASLYGGGKLRSLGEAGLAIPVTS